MRRLTIGLFAIALVFGVSTLPATREAAAATPTVTLSPSGPYTDGQTITVSGSGFPSISTDPGGITIVECSDPGGTSAGLPGNNLSCDGDTINPLPIDQGASGDFTTSYTISQLSVPPGNIRCDSSDDCVLWAGVNLNTDFEQPLEYAFSGSFLIASAPASTPESPLALALPLLAVAVIGGGVVVVTRRRRTPSSTGV